MQLESLKYVRNRFNLPFTDEQLEEIPFYRPSENSPEIKYMKARREALGGYLPARRKESESLPIPELSVLMLCSKVQMVKNSPPPWLWFASSLPY